MRLTHATVLLILILLLAFFLNCSYIAKASDAQALSDVYFGVDVAFGSVADTEQLIDKVSAYTNFFVVGCIGNYNETRLIQVSQYLCDKGLSFIVYTDDTRYPSKQWIDTARNLWGNRFLGIYFYDEPGGRQLDQATLTVQSADDYNQAANTYVGSFHLWVRNGPYAVTQSFAFPTEYQIFTSDYAFYWFDYQAGYDTIFAEFGWNYSRQLNVALCRGAATAFNKDWGAMITWTYRQPPYIESGPELYNDLVLAYQNGAKYIVIFDSNLDYSASILQQEHLDAMQQFWQYTKDHPRSPAPTSQRTAYVLPKDYAYGFRGPNDRIWGLWSADAWTSSICMNASTLLQRYGTNLDIIYPDAPQTVQSLGYQNLYTWNSQPLANQTYPPRPSATLVPHDPHYGIFSSNLYLLTIAAIVIAIIIVSIAVLKIKNRRRLILRSGKFYMNFSATLYSGISGTI